MPLNKRRISPPKKTDTAKRLKGLNKRLGKKSNVPVDKQVYSGRKYK